MRNPVMNAPNHLALFDCDGTLVDGQYAICAAMDLAFADVALPAPDHHAVRRIVGLSVAEAMAVLAPSADKPTVTALAHAYKMGFRTLRQEGRRETDPLYPGILAMLDAVQSAGWTMAIATGKSDRGLGRMIAAHGLEGRFVSLQTADRHPSKPHPSMALLAMEEAGATPATTVMIGDTHFDMAMGRAAGTHALGVDWGYHDAQELRDAGARDVAMAVADIPLLLESFR